MFKLKKRVTRRGGGLLFALSVIFALVLVSCNVSRSVTTTSQYYQRGDTSVVIQTKTVETYDGTIKKP